MLPPAPLPGGDSVNTIPAQVEAVEFRGPLFRLTLRVLEHSMVADVSARRAGALNLGRDAAVQLHLPSERLHVFSA